MSESVVIQAQVQKSPSKCAIKGCPNIAAEEGPEPYDELCASCREGVMAIRGALKTEGPMTEDQLFSVLKGG